MSEQRKHRATGQKAPGGARPGAGRPVGANNVLPAGAVAALRACRHRIPDDAAPPAAEAAGRAFSVLVDVMDGKVQRNAFLRLTAAKAVREEVCGPVPKRVDVEGALEVVIRTVAEDEEEEAPPPVAPEA